ncbi:MAG: DUF4783 domain-containing protein [Bacteroidetes bacterium]|nr:MAG: DUF4783 domain-containing protein [Bacteroidota bacterium]REJ99698.1 MAG: DUF4783 domain-containing protein [Bacteroidota bacterium]REK33931.1 MAG: DUF4783 domain-containing protein [Bacteroidota bacterium]REK47697.1 MAG: DUF4783 domain-containing protein [Bacteroidota bacterium]
MKKLIKGLIFTAFMMIAFSSASQDVYEDLSNAVKGGNSQQIASYFGKTVDLTILDQEDVYSRQQAEQILKDFFSKNPPKSFQVVHKGSSKDGKHYAIGNMQTTSSKNFRVSFFLKISNSSKTLMELRIENE